MMWTIIIGLTLLSLVALINGGTDDLLERVLMGGGFMILVGWVSAAIALMAFAVWIVPSAIVFSATYRALGRKTSSGVAVMVAAFVTALVASIALGVITTLLARDFDSIFAFGTILYGPVSLFVAPVVGWLIYRDGPRAVTE